MTFENLLKKQQELDEIIDAQRPNGFKPRKRTEKDIILSMIAEIIEFNEETPETHKTWKEKEFDTEEARKEAIDILFFYLQLINNLNCSGKEKLIELNEFSLLSYDYTKKSFYSRYDLIEIISRLIIGEYHFVFFSLLNIFRLLGMSRSDIDKYYMNKWEFNANNRIDGDWAK